MGGGGQLFLGVVSPCKFWPLWFTSFSSQFSSGAGIILQRLYHPKAPNTSWSAWRPRLPQCPVQPFLSGSSPHPWTSAFGEWSMMRFAVESYGLAPALLSPQGPSPLEDAKAPQSCCLCASPSPTPYPVCLDNLSQSFSRDGSIFLNTPTLQLSNHSPVHLIPLRILGFWNILEGYFLFTLLILPPRQWIEAIGCWKRRGVRRT